ncbi:MAG: hypothetical protein BWY30_01153 [Tenericutes bacterium ADurb.Bin239]|nr:MAG: hypothetical protein BWY30_01153 [Tenericutes bacterium ADurb.Bin239]
MIKIKVKDAVQLGACNVPMVLEPLLSIAGQKIGYYSNAYGWRFDLYAVPYGFGLIYFIIGYQHIKGPTVHYLLCKPLVDLFNDYEGGYFEKRQFAIDILTKLYNQAVSNV